MGAINSTSALKELFAKAEKEGGVEYIFTLVRVTGITQGEDPIIKLSSILKGTSSTLGDKKEILFAGIEECLAILSNLLYCSTRKSYNYCPFRHLYKGSVPNIEKPTLSQMMREIEKICSETNQPKMKKLVEEKLIGAILRINSSIALDSDVSVEEELRFFLQTLIKDYNAERLKFKNRPRLYKLPNFEVLELLVDDNRGLYGFFMHFSNGSSAKFIRNEDSTESMNIRPDMPLEFFVGNLDNMTKEWRVRDKRLYEVGLPGRYNKLGEWKPLIYPASSKITASFRKKAISLSKDDQIQGCLFYIMCTGHQVIEFIVYTDIEFPDEDITFGKRIHLWRCPNLEDFQNYRIYDGTYYLNSFDAEEVKMAISIIGIALNRMAFAYNAKLQWRLKYNIVSTLQESIAKLEEKDLAILKSIMEKFPQNQQDALILDAAIDWYNRGVGARDVFARFMCYYRAIESIAMSISKGKGDFGLGYIKEEKVEVLKRRIKCIEEKHDELYEKDKVRFVAQAYTECIEGSAAKTKKVLELVFGQDHKYIKALFEKQNGDGYSLTQIRSMIAHGNLTLIEKMDERIVRDRLYEMNEIAEEFIMRLSCALKPSDDIPKWSGYRGFGMSVRDPRTCLVASREDIFPEDADWRIRPEWCF